MEWYVSRKFDSLEKFWTLSEIDSSSEDPRPDAEKGPRNLKHRLAENDNKATYGREKDRQTVIGDQEGKSARREKHYPEVEQEFDGLHKH